MSILNLASDGLPNILVVLYDVLARSTRPVSQDELVEMVAPDRVVANDKVRQTLARWIELGLFVKSKEGIELLERPQKRLRNDADLIAKVRAASRDRALHPENNMDLWATESARAADFTRAMAWTLAQDVYRPLSSTWESLQHSQMVDGTGSVITNTSRFSGLKAWGQFLGFLRPVLASEIEVDPTVAIRDVLPSLLKAGEGMPVANFIDGLAMKMPILDRGTWRLEVLSCMKPDALPSMAEGQLSSSLSRALLNMMRKEEFFLENRSDTRSGVVFTGRDGVREDLRFTWIRRAEDTRAAA